MKRTWKTLPALAAFLMGTMAFATTPAFGQTSDVTPPMLVDFSFSPTTINVSAGSQTVAVTAHVTDDLSGTSSGTVVFRNGTQSVTGILLFNNTGTRLDGIFVANVIFPQFAIDGTWTVASVSLSDLVGNGTALLTPVLVSRGFPTQLTVTSIPDTDAPVVAAITISPTAVDVSAADQSISFTLDVLDAASGVAFRPCPGGNFNFFSVTLRSPSGAQNRFIAAGGFNLVGGTAFAGSWQGSLPMPRFSEAGTWVIQSIQVRDCAGNVRFLNTAQLAALNLPTNVAVTSSPADVQAPFLTSLSYTPIAINTSTSNQFVTVRMGVMDDLAGANVSFTTPFLTFFEAGVRFRSPSGNQVRTAGHTAFALISGTALDGIWQATSLFFPQFSEEGTWVIDFLTIKDAVRNIRTFNTGALQALGFPTNLIVIKPSLIPDGTAGPAGGTVEDTTFGFRASITFPPGALTGTTTVAIDVLASPLPVPNPTGFQGPGTPFVNIELTPTPAFPLPPPGMTIVLPLANPLPAGAALNLYKLDTATGQLVEAINVFGLPVIGFAAANGLSATFTGVASLSTIVGLIPESIAVKVDIKPGSADNSINLESTGVLPVAILSTAAFDARTVDVTTVTLADAFVQFRNNGRPMASFEDVNRDGLVDLMLFFDTHELQILSHDTEAHLRGLTLAGVQIVGKDSIRLVK